MILNEADIDESIREIIRSGRPLLVVKQDECVFTNRPMLLSTTLGSCVAAAFLHRPSHNCAVFHAFWPTARGRTELDAPPCRFADTAVLGVAERFRKCGISPSEVDVVVAGGSYGGQSRIENYNVGRRNVETAMETLNRLCFTIRETHVLGSATRTLYLDTVTCRTWIRTRAHEPAEAISAGKARRPDVVLVPGVGSCHLDLVD